MPTDSLLIAGPVDLEAMDARPPLLGGAGAVAAMAAAATVPTQLWARVGDDFPEACRRQFAERRIDDGGVIGEGATNTVTVADGRRSIHGPSLPEAEPHDPVEVGCCLAVGLDAAEGRRALACFASLPEAATRIVVVAPDADACRHDPDYLRACAAAADLLLLPSAVALAALDCSDPVVASGLLTEAGATAVGLSAGPFGGLFRYKNKLGTWAADPQPGKDDRHALAVLAGITAAHLTEHGSLDLRTLRRALAVGSAVAGHSIGDYGARRIRSQSRGDQQSLFLRLRRNNKA